MHAVVEMGEDRMPQEHAPMPQRCAATIPTLRDDPLVQQGDASSLQAEGDVAAASARAETCRRQQAAPSKAAPAAKDVVIDVIVAYTKKAASNYTDVKRELVDLAIEEANESFRISSLGNIKLRLVHAYQTDYVEEGAAFRSRLALRRQGRRLHGGDPCPARQVSRPTSRCSSSTTPRAAGWRRACYADADEAFAVVHHECAATTYSLAHEIGHLIGARHDLNLDKIMTPFPYGHGYVNGTKWRDIMSYKESCGGCPRLPVWSSPKVLVKGEPAGTPELDNARVISEQAARVAAFR